MPTTTTGRVTCLVCAAQWPEIDHMTGRHTADPTILGRLATYAEPFGDVVVCPGTGFRPAQDDGVDHVRRYALRQTLHARAQLHLRSHMRDDATDFTTELALRGSAILEAEALVALWQPLAIHGDWPTAVGAALQVMRRDDANSPADILVQTARRSAAVQFIRGARQELSVEYQDGLSAEDFATMLFGI